MKVHRPFWECTNCARSAQTVLGVHKLLRWCTNRAGSAQTGLIVHKLVRGCPNLLSLEPVKPPTPPFLTGNNGSARALTCSPRFWLSSWKSSRVFSCSRWILTRTSSLDTFTGPGTCREDIQDGWHCVGCGSMELRWVRGCRSSRWDRHAGMLWVPQVMWAVRRLRGTFKGQCTQTIWLTFSTILASIGPQWLPRWPERRVQ